MFRQSRDVTDALPTLNFHRFREAVCSVSVEMGKLMGLLIVRTSRIPNGSRLALLQDRALTLPELSALRRGTA